MLSVERGSNVCDAERPGTLPSMRTPKIFDLGMWMKNNTKTSCAEMRASARCDRETRLASGLRSELRAHSFSVSAKCTNAYANLCHKAVASMPVCTPRTEIIRLSSSYPGWPCQRRSRHSS